MPLPASAVAVRGPVVLARATTEALPSAPVTTVPAVAEKARPGPEKVTTAPLTAAPSPSLTRITSGFVKAVWIWADWPSPLSTLMVAGCAQAPTAPKRRVNTPAKRPFR